MRFQNHNQKKTLALVIELEIFLLFLFAFGFVFFNLKNFTLTKLLYYFFTYLHIDALFYLKYI